MFCRCSRDSLYTVAGASPLGMPVPLVTQAEYDAACSRCEVWVDVNTAAQHGLILGALRYDKRPTANGRALQRDLPELGLCAYDRLRAPFRPLGRRGI